MEHKEHKNTEMPLSDRLRAALVNNNCLEGYLLAAAALLLLFIIGFVIHSNFTYYWSLLNSEMAEDLAFVREAANQGTLFPREWLYTREIRLMHITSVILPIYLITGNLNLSYPIASSLMLLVNCALFFYMMRYKKNRLLPIVTGLIVLIMFFATMGSGELYPIFNIWFLNSSYAVHLASVLFTLGVYLRFKAGTYTFTLNNKRAIVLLIITALVAFGQGLQSDRLIIGLYAPLFLTELCFLAGKYRTKLKLIDRPVIFVLIICACALLGSVLSKVFFGSGVWISDFNKPVDSKIIHNAQISDRLGYFTDNLFRALGVVGNTDLFSLAGMLYFVRMTSVIVLIAVVRKIWSKSAPNNTAATVLLFSTVLSSVFMTFLLFEASLTSRYLFPVVILMSALACLMIDCFIKNKQRLFTAAACLVIFAVSAVNIYALPINKNEALTEDRKMVADFIRDTGINYGYGVLWHGKVIEAVGDGDFTIFFIFNDIRNVTRRGVTLSQFNHTEDRVFLVLSSVSANKSLENEGEREILETGERHDLERGWTVYTFDYNPWRSRG
jgi:hypothetical protein